MGGNWKATAAAGALIAGLSTPAFAQRAAPAPAAADQGIPDIVVTAQKRSEAIQSVPIAISAVNAAAIKEARIEGALDLQRISPSVNISTSFGAVEINIRGLGYEASNSSSEASVLAYVDGVYIARPTALGAVFDDLERIEVLRGPQGTLYGRNATGGVVNFITRTPGDKFAANISGTYGSYNRVKVNGGVDIPLGQETAARISFIHDSHGGDEINTVNGERLRNLNANGVRGTLVTHAGDNLKLTARGDYYKDRSRGATYDLINGSIQPGANGVGSTPADPNGYFDDVDAGPVATLPNYNDGKHLRTETRPSIAHTNWGGSLTADWDLNSNVSLKSISAYRDSDFERRNNDYDGSDAATIVELRGTEHSKVFTQELNLNGKTDGGATWVVGGYYFHESLDNLYLNVLPAEGAIYESLGFATADNYDVVEPVKTRSFSLFAQGTAPITDKLKLTAGLRKNFDHKQATLLAATFGAIGCDDVHEKGKWNDLTWRIGLDYQVTPHNLLYATISTGFKAGGLNTGECSNPTYDPENVTSYEVGTKNTFFGGKLLINFDGFYYDYKNLQVNVFTATTVRTENASSARIYGLEFETKVRPIENLELAATFSAIHSEYLKFESFNPLQVGLPDAMAEDLSGRTIAHTPKRTADGSVSYKIPVGDDGSINLRYDARYNSGWYGDPFEENVGIKQHAYVVQNARIAYDLGNYEIGAFVDNFTNKLYAENRYTFGTGAGVVASWAPLRTWGVFASAKF